MSPATIEAIAHIWEHQPGFGAFGTRASILNPEQTVFEEWFGANHHALCEADIARINEIAARDKAGADAAEAHDESSDAEEKTPKKEAGGKTVTETEKLTREIDALLVEFRDLLPGLQNAAELITAMNSFLSGENDDAALGSSFLLTSHEELSKQWEDLMLDDGGVLLAAMHQAKKEAAADSDPENSLKGVKFILRFIKSKVKTTVVKSSKEKESGAEEFTTSSMREATPVDIRLANCKIVKPKDKVTISANLKKALFRSIKKVE